mgnify:CR=1 FL=1
MRQHKRSHYRPGKYGNQKLNEICDANRRGLLAGCICRINLSVTRSLLKADEAGSPIDPSNGRARKRVRH